MTAPTPNAALAQAALAMRIRDVLVQFSWSNFGLDLVDDAETEWADALAEDVFAEIFGPRPDGGHGYRGDGIHGCDALLAGKVRCGAGRNQHPDGGEGGNVTVGGAS